MRPKCKEQAKGRIILGHIVNTVLAVLLIYAAVYLLCKGTIFTVRKVRSRWGF